MTAFACGTAEPVITVERTNEKQTAAHSRPVRILFQQLFVVSFVGSTVITGSAVSQWVTRLL